MRKQDVKGNLLAILIVAALGVARPAHGYDFCEADSSMDDPQNVIVVLLDDSSTVDLPFFNPPVVWPDQNDPPRVKNTALAWEGRYSFHNKKVRAGNTSSRFWYRDNQKDPENSQVTHYPCNSEGSFNDATTGCMYDMRVYRDVAANFIARHAHEPFYLEIMPQALHNASDAPKRTLDHYRTIELQSDLPANAAKVWGALEEVDAAVGAIIDLLEGVCDGTSRQGKAGDPCTASSECGGGTCVTNLDEKTVILFTSDQGRPGSRFGNPVYREGKGTTYEGGVRVGLLAWGRGADANIGGASTAPSARRRGDAFLGSQVDILPTVLHYATCAPNAQNADSQYELHACSDDPRKLCDPAANPSDCGASGTCGALLLAGKSLVNALRGDQGAQVRDFAFAAYPNKPSVVTGPAGHDYSIANSDATAAQTICTYEAIEDATTTDGGKVDRIRIGGSCHVGCAQNSDCVGEICTLGGTYCVGPHGSDFQKRCRADGGGAGARERDGVRTNAVRALR